MKPARAAELTGRIATAFARDLWGAKATDRWILDMAERMLSWDDAAAELAVELLVDTGRALPYWSEIRDAYAAAGGDILDPGRNMSPAIEHREPMTEEERAEAERIRHEVVDHASQLAARMSAGRTGEDES